MKLADIVEKLGLEVVCGQEKLTADVEYAYVSDMLSDVMANAQEGAIWLTIQVHQNIVAVAAMREFPAIVCTKNRRPEADTIEKAIDENIALLVADKTTFEAAGLLWEMGIRP